MNKKAFSLVELMTVMVIMALIIGIAAIAFNNINYENREKLNTKLTRTIENASDAYCSNINNKCAAGGTIILKTLVDEGLLEGDLINYVEEVDLDLCSTIAINAVGEYNFEYVYDINAPSNYDGLPELTSEGECP